ncbi:hypothetical protein QN226_31890, partial [Sinorhizobium sp. 6-117]|nr:hypothetical protein [Sinorhizobium sp. 6-117]
VYGANHVTYARNITDVDDKINARAPRILSDASRSLFHEGASPAAYGAAPRRGTRGGCRNSLFDDV